MNIKTAVKSIMPDFDKVTSAVKSAEAEMGAGNGAVKRDWVVSTLNKSIDIPGIPEWTEELLIGLLVDYAISLLNRWFGHEWLAKIGEINAS